MAFGRILLQSEVSKMNVTKEYLFHCAAVNKSILIIANEIFLESEIKYSYLTILDILC